SPGQRPRPGCRAHVEAPTGRNGSSRVNGLFRPVGAHHKLEAAGFLGLRPRLSHCAPLGLLMVLGLVPALFAADVATRRPEFVLHTVTGKDFSGPLQRLGPNWAVELADGGGEAAGAEVVTLRRAGAVLPTFPQQPHVVLAN